jgi:hypothetical protein
MQCSLEIGTPHPLAQVAAHGGHVPQLLGGAEQQRLRHAGIPIHDLRSPSDIGHPGEGADAHATAGRCRHIGER